MANDRHKKAPVGARPFYLEPADCASVTLEGPALCIEMPGKARAYLPLRRISRIILSTRVQMDMAAILACAEGESSCFCTTGRKNWWPVSWAVRGNIPAFVNGCSTSWNGPTGPSDTRTGTMPWNGEYAAYWLAAFKRRHHSMAGRIPSNNGYGKKRSVPRARKAQH